MRLAEIERLWVFLLMGDIVECSFCVWLAGHVLGERGEGAGSLELTILERSPEKVARSCGSDTYLSCFLLRSGCDSFGHGGVTGEVHRYKNQPRLFPGGR